MDPPTNLNELVDDLDVNIDELAAALSPLLTVPLRTQASTLPLLDKAKLHILAAASIESLLYSALLTAGVDAKEHPIFAELARLKSYNAKIKSAEDSQTAPNMRLDKGAAARFIRHGIGSSKRADLERAERIAKEKAIAAVKAARINVKFDEQVEEERQVEVARKRKAEEISKDEEGEIEEESSEDEKEDEVEDEEEGADEDTAAAVAAAVTPGKMDTDEAPDHTAVTPSTSAYKIPLPSSATTAAADTPALPTTTPTPSKRSKRRKSKQQQNLTSTPTSTSTPATPTLSTTPKPKKRKKTKKAKLGSLKKESERMLPAEQQDAAPPKTRGETFRALLDGSHAELAREREEEKKAWRAERVRF